MSCTHVFALQLWIALVQVGTISSHMVKKPTGLIHAHMNLYGLHSAVSPTQPLLAWWFLLFKFPAALDNWAKQSDITQVISRHYRNDCWPFSVMLHRVPPDNHTSASAVWYIASLEPSWHTIDTLLKKHALTWRQVSQMVSWHEYLARSTQGRQNSRYSH